MSKYIVYIHIIPKKISGYKFDKYYVGITCRKPEIRWNKGKGYISQPFYRAIKKYGWENIKHKILYKNLTLVDAKKKEIEMISFYKSKLGQFGYNVTDGGDTSRNPNNDKAIYCIELKKAFKNSRIASELTKDNSFTITNRCKFFNKNHKHQKKGKVKYNYVFVEDMYLDCENKRIETKSKPIVWLQNNKIYCGFQTINKILNKNVRRTYLTINQYYKLLKNGNLYKCNRFMKIEDYFKLFENTQ